MSYSRYNGTIYLIHFDQRVGEPGRNGAQHYLGWTWQLADRVRTHQANKGARILAHCNRNGIGWKVVRTWSGNQTQERRMKRNGHFDRLCPSCVQAGIMAPVTVSQTGGVCV